MAAFPLDGLRVVELGSLDAVAYCGKQFADFGAEVIKVEPPAGDVGRTYAPLVDTGAGHRESAYFAWLNTNKSSITADLDNADDIARIRKLLSTADLLLDGRHPQEIKASPLSHESLRETDPGLGITAISWFSDTGPYSGYHPSEAVARSLAGMVKLIGAVEGPPMLGRDGQAAVFAGLTAFIPSLAALYNREHGARRYRTNVHEALLQVTEFDTLNALESGFSRTRAGINIFGRGYPSGTWETQDGILGVSVATPAQWTGFCQIIGKPELAHEPKYSKSLDRFIHAAELKQIFTPIFKTRPAREWFEPASNSGCRWRSCRTCANCWSSRSTASAARSAPCGSARRNSKVRCCRSTCCGRRRSPTAPRRWPEPTTTRRSSRMREKPRARRLPRNCR